MAILSKHCCKPKARGFCGEAFGEFASLLAEQVSPRTSASCLCEIHHQVQETDDAATAGQGLSNGQLAAICRASFHWEISSCIKHVMLGTLYDLVALLWPAHHPSAALVGC